MDVVGTVPVVAWLLVQLQVRGQEQEQEQGRPDGDRREGEGNFFLPQ